MCSILWNNCMSDGDSNCGGSDGGEKKMGKCM